ncbi:MAG: hypothetical protein KAX38_01375 [Candidatus Krumholzibacteria bacterium]|nr:hypothetical protein [Candidatus Krumholzibacteria bacterium]
MKSPGIATFLAVIPGCGYLYSVHCGSALSTFIINGLLIGSSIDAYNKEQYILASILGFISAAWYSGNFYGSAAAARRYNYRITSAYSDRITF